VMATGRKGRIFWGGDQTGNDVLIDWGFGV
jgi:hypothetical protein